VRLKVIFVFVNLCNTHNSGNIASFKYSVFTRELESARGLRFKLLSKVKDLSIQGHRQSRTLEKW